MATLRAAVKSVLEGDVTLAAILTGGVYSRAGISRTLTPDAFDSKGAIKPCAVVTEEATNRIGHREDKMEMVSLVVWLYEDEGSGYTLIDTAKMRVRALLHDQTVTTSDGYVHHIVHVYSLGDSFDDVLSAEMTHERFTVYRRRL